MQPTNTTPLDAEVRASRELLSLTEIRSLGLQGWDFWQAIDPLFDLKRFIYGMYGIGADVQTPDGPGTILSIHGRAIKVGLKSIALKQKLHGIGGKFNNGGLHRTYLFKDFDCPLTLRKAENISDHEKKAIGYVNIVTAINQVWSYQYLQQQYIALPILFNGVKYTVDKLTDKGIYQIK